MLTALLGVLGLIFTAGSASAQLPLNEPFNGSFNNPNWSLLGSGSLTPGWLQLTPAATNQVGGAILDAAFPSNAGLEIRFEYDISGGTGADGLSVFLFDGSVTSGLGPQGGGLGYSSSSGPSGVTSAYVGVGFDEWGEFSNSGAGPGGPGLSPDSVVLRGSGTGITGYPYLTGVAVPSGVTTGGTGRAVRIHLINEQITVEANLGFGFQTLISYNLAGAPGQVALPATFKIGFGGSTGGSTNLHRVRNLTVKSLVDVAVTQTDGVTSATPGSSLTYTLVASNAGPSDEAAATLTDTFPADLTCTWTSVASGGASGSTSGSGNLYQALSLPAGSAMTYTVTCLINPSATGTLSNTATITGSVADLAPGDNSATDADTVLVPSADLSVTKTDGVTTATPGGNLTYTLVASNAGPSDVSGATLTDTLPAALTCTYTSAAAGGATGNTSGSGNLSQALSLPAGGLVTYTVSCTIDPTATGMLSNTASISSSVTDPVPGNNSATDADTVLVPSADLSVTKTDGAASVTAGGNVTYTITAVNNGPSAVPAATVYDILPSGLTCSTTSLAAGGATGNTAISGNISQTLALPAGSSVTYTATCAVSDLASGSIANTATISSAVTDDVPGNNSATDTDSVRKDIRLGVSLSDDPDPVRVGQPLSYAVTVTNNGLSTATGLTVVQQLPPGVVFRSAGGAGWTCGESGGVVTCGPVELGASASAAPITVTVTSPATPGDVTSQVTAQAPAASAVTATATTTVEREPLPIADLGVALNPGNPHVAVEQTVTVVATVGNHGPETAAAVTLTWRLPADVTLLSWSPAGDCVLATDGLRCLRSSLAPAASWPVEIQLRAPAGPGPRELGAAVTSVTAADENPANDTASATLEVEATADLSVTLLPAAETVTAGEDVAYTVTVRNGGPSMAEVVRVSSTVSAASGPVDFTGCPDVSAAPLGCRLGSLAPGAEAVYHMTVTAPPDTIGKLVHTVSVGADTFDANPGDNTSAVEVRIDPFGEAAADLRLTIPDPPTEAVPGEALGYTVRVRNDGPAAVSGVELVHDLPADVGGAANESLSLAPGEEKTLSVALDVAPDALGERTFSVYLTTGVSGVTDPNPTDNGAELTVALTPRAEVGLRLAGTPAQAVAGKPLVLVLEVSNAGPSTVRDVELTASWTCSGPEEEGASCGDFAETVDVLPPGTAHVFPLRGEPAVGAELLTVTAALAPAGRSRFVAAGFENDTVTASIPVVPSQVIRLGAPRSVSQDGGNPHLAFEDSGSAVVVYEQRTAGAVVTMGQRLRPDGAPDGAPFEVGPGRNPVVITAPDEAEGAAAPPFKAAGRELVLRQSDEELSVILGKVSNEAENALSHDRPSSPQVHPTGVRAGNGYLVAWQSEREKGSGPAKSAIYGRVANFLGKPTGEAQRIDDLLKRPDPGPPALAADGEGGFFAIWDTPRDGAAGQRDVVGQRLALAADGKTLRLIDPVRTVNSGGESPKPEPALAFEPASRRYLAVWAEKDGIHGALFEQDASTVRIDPPLVIGKSGDTSSEVAAQSGQLVVTFKRTILGLTWTYAQKVDKDGKLEGGPVKVSSSTPSDSGRRPAPAPEKAETESERPAVAFAPPRTAPEGAGTDVFFVVWSDQGDGPGGDSGLWNQRYALTADLQIAVFDEPDPVLEEGEASLTYTVWIVNQSGGAAEDVEVKHSFLAGVRPLSITGCPDFPETFASCTLGQIEGGGTRQYTIETVVAADLKGTLPLVAAVTSSTPDPDDGDNLVLQETHLGAADLGLELAAGAADAGTAAFEVKVHNAGPSTAESVTLRLDLGRGTELLATSLECTPDLVCALGDLARGEERRATFRLAGAPGTVQVAPTVTASAFTFDPEPDDNTARQPVVLAAPDLTVHLTAPPAVAPASRFTVVVDVANAGDARVEDVVLETALPPGVTAFSSVGCEEDPAGLPRCRLGGLRPGKTRRVRFELQAGAEVDGALGVFLSSAWPGRSTASVRLSTGDPTLLPLVGGRFAVRVDWRDPRGGASGSGTALPLSDNTGFFYFFNANNVELITKVLDGGRINGNYWFFYGGLSDVEYTITVTDTQTGAERTYHHPPGEVCGGSDTAAFPGADGSGALTRQDAVRAPASKDGVCVADATGLCLGADRFRVTVDWASDRAAGAGQAIPGTEDTGYFWFFNETNVELAVKVLDGTRINGKHWLFYGGLSDVEYTITVTDTQTGAVREYRHPRGEVCGGSDTQAF